LLAVAEDENSFVFSALDREMNALVPTQRLWSRINDSIETEKPDGRFGKMSIHSLRCRAGSVDDGHGRIADRVWIACSALDCAARAC
jgi:hypothetical protein